MWECRLNNQEFDIKRLQPPVQNGGHSVMILGAIWSDGHSELVESQGNITLLNMIPYCRNASFQYSQVVES